VTFTPTPPIPTATLTPTPTETPTPNPNRQVFVGPDGQMQFVDQISGSSLTTIPVGTTVEWVWQSANHSTTSGNCTPICIPGLPGPDNWSSLNHDPPFTFTYTFNNVGTFSYFCLTHGTTMGMTGVVNVLPATARGARR
jgi:plastocyanin